MGLWDSLKNALNIGGNEPIYTTSYELPTKLDKAKYLAKKGLSSIKDGKSFLFDKIGGFTDKVGDKVENALFGQLMPNKIEATEITQDKDGNTVIESGVGTPTREGGFLNDLIGGFRENRDNAFMPANLMADKNKGFVYRLGEGLGSLARIGESPLGRGILVGGAVTALGGSGGDALTYGLGATAQNQQLRGADRLYRDSLIKAEQDSLIAERDSLLNDENFKKLPTETQQQYLSNISDRIDAVANRYNNVRGYISPQSYNAMLQAKQLQDNAEWRKANLETQQNQNKILNDLRQKELNLGYARLEADNKNGGRIMPANSATALSGTQQGIQQMDTLIKEIPNFAKKGLAGPVGSLRRFNPYDADAQAFQQYVNTYKQVIGKGLEGGVLRKEDEAKYEKIIPRMGDTEEVLMRKAQQLQQMLIEKYNTDLQALYNAGYNTGNFNYYGGTQKDSLGIL